MQDFKNKFNLQGIVGDIKSNIKSMINPSASASSSTCSTSAGGSNSGDSADCGSLAKNMAELTCMISTIQKACAEQSHRLEECSRLVHAASKQVQAACSPKKDHCCDIDES